MTNSDNRVNEALDKAFETIDRDKVDAVYLFGSTLSNLATKDSDVDLCLVMKQDKRNLVFESLKSGQTHGEDDVRFMESYKFLQLLTKTNPSMLEMSFKRPLYVSDSFKPFADFLYENRTKLVSLNKARYFSGSFHMLKNNYNKIKNQTGKAGLGRPGKEVVNFYKGYYQAMANDNGTFNDSYVTFTGELRDKLMDYKSKNKYNEMELKTLLLDMETKLSELEELKGKYKDYKQNDELFTSLLELL